MKLLIITQKVDQNDQLLGFFIEWIRKFSEKFEKVTVLCLEKGEFSLPENVEVVSLGKEENNFQFSIFNFQSILNVTIFKKIKYLLRFYKYIWRERDDYNTVFVHMNPIWVVVGGLFWRSFNKKIFFWYTSGGVTTKLKLAERFADVIFTASEDSFRIKSKKVKVMGHGIDTELFKPDLAKKNLTNKLKILSVGRISPVKNYETLIDAVKILKDDGVELLVTMVGETALDSDREYELKIKSKIKELSLENYFKFTGKIVNRDLSSYYQSHDIFIHLSKTGSLDKVILEAMACNIKFLSSNQSSKSFLPSELIFDENDAKDLADKIKNIAKIKSGIPGVPGLPFTMMGYVIENHNLDNLINKLSLIINDY
ncbi:MAG: glycosyltransferase family 4 protein [bacterium]|nr:glycosyltransferase family 4 protein [bacterium]